MLRRDFERYGVHLSGSQRDRMTALVHAANQLGTRFTQNVLDPSQLGQLELPAGAAAGGWWRVQQAGGGAWWLQHASGGESDLGLLYAPWYA
jgi:hypothetical protein